MSVYKMYLLIKIRQTKNGVVKVVIANTEQDSEFLIKISVAEIRNFL